MLNTLLEIDLFVPTPAVNKNNVKHVNQSPTTWERPVMKIKSSKTRKNAGTAIMFFPRAISARWELKPLMTSASQRNVKQYQKMLVLRFTNVGILVWAISERRHASLALNSNAQRIKFLTGKMKTPTAVSVISKI